MSFILHPQLGILGLPKPMNVSKIIFYGMVWNMIFAHLWLSVMYANTTRERIKFPSTLQSLMIPPSIWRDIFMDFIVGLPKSRNKLVIMVVVYHLSKNVDLYSLEHPFTTSTMAQIFMDNIFKLHGFPYSIVSNRDPNFTNNFWK